MYSKTREKGGQSWEEIRGGGERGMRNEKTVWERWKGRKGGEEGERRRKAGVIKNSKHVVEKIKGKIGAKEKNGTKNQHVNK